MSSFTRQQQLTFCWTYECLSDFFYHPYMGCRAERILTILDEWRTHEDENFLSRTLETFKVLPAEQDAFLNWVEQRKEVEQKGVEVVKVPSTHS